jgi:hypothetical protein
MGKLSSQKLMSLWFIFNGKVYFVSMWKFQDFYMAMMFSGDFKPCVFGSKLLIGSYCKASIILKTGDIHLHFIL